MSVNITPQQIQGGDLAEKINELCAAAGIAPDQMQVELTERALVAEPDTAQHEIAKLRSYGFPIALDDFGSGYSSFSYLQRFQFDVLKLDKSLMDEVHADTRACAVVSGLVSFAQALNLPLVAEGIECAKQQEILRALGVALGQDFWFAYPQPIRLQNSSRVGVISRCAAP